MDEFAIDDTVKIWKKFKNSKKIFYQLPNVKEINKFHEFLTNGGNYIYATSFEDCEEKIKYWKYVLDQYNEYEFIMPFSPGMGYELRLDEINKYHASHKALSQLEEINQMLAEISIEFFEMEHVSF